MKISWEFQIPFRMSRCINGSDHLKKKKFQMFANTNHQTSDWKGFFYELNQLIQFSFQTSSKTSHVLKSNFCFNLHQIIMPWLLLHSRHNSIGASWLSSFCLFLVTLTIHFPYPITYKMLLFIYFFLLVPPSFHGMACYFSLGRKWSHAYLKVVTWS